MELTTINLPLKEKRALRAVTRGLLSGSHFNLYGVEYILTHNGVDVITFKEAGKGNKKEFRVNY